MKISELATLSGAPLSAVKYYQREGLLHRSEKTAPNQAIYDQSHVQRVRLIRALLGAGGLSISSAKAVIDALDADSLAQAFGVAQAAMSAPRTTDPEPSPQSRERVSELAHAHGWKTTPENPGFEVAARALDGFQSISFEPSDSFLGAYAAAAAKVAKADLTAVMRLPDREQKTELMVIGSVLGNPLLAGLRSLAHENETHTHLTAQES